MDDVRVERATRGAGNLRPPGGSAEWLRGSVVGVGRGGSRSSGDFQDGVEGRGRFDGKPRMRCDRSERRAGARARDISARGAARETRGIVSGVVGRLGGRARGCEVRAHLVAYLELEVDVSAPSLGRGPSVRRLQVQRHLVPVLRAHRRVAARVEREAPRAVAHAEDIAVVLLPALVQRREGIHAPLGHAHPSLPIRHRDELLRLHLLRLLHPRRAGQPTSRARF